MATYTNKVVRISLAGGLIGLLTTNPRRAIDSAIDKANQDGFHCHQVVPHSSRNLLVVLAQYAVLFMTFFLWTWGAGYLLLLEKERAA
jgi:hypothetical protein